MVEKTLRKLHYCWYKNWVVFYIL